MKEKYAGLSRVSSPRGRGRSTSTTRVIRPGRALITGDAIDLFTSLNGFKTPPLWGVRKTAPYFHDNSARTLEDVMTHYARFFAAVSDPSDPMIFTAQDQADIVAFLKLLR